MTIAQVTIAQEMTRPGRSEGKRVGLIVPSVNAVLEPDLAWVAPRGVTFHAARVPLTATTPEGLREMNKGVAAAATLLAHLSPDLVAFACTSGSLIDGESGLQQQVAAIGEITGAPVVATASAVIAAFRHLGVDRVALATPYGDAVNEAERAFFEAHGVGVATLVGLGLSGAAIREVPTGEIRALARASDARDAQAIFISCTDFRALEVLEELEQELGKPVLCSNQVTLWAILRALGLPTRYPGLGRMLAE